MNRLGIVARIVMIVTVALFLSQMAVVLAYLWQREKSPPAPFAIADRIVSVVRLLDALPEASREQAIDVASISGFHVSIATSLPSSFRDAYNFSRLRAITQRKMEDYAPGRMVRAGQMEDAGRWRATSAMSIATTLKTGEAVVFTVSDETTLRLWNVPIGFIAGFFGIAVAIFATLAVARETRPIARLARSVDELGNRVEPVPVSEQGARELRTLIRAINKMQDRILGLVNNRTLFLGAISHDLKTYLTRFRLRLEIMPPSPHREKAVKDVEAMEALLNDVLEFAGETAVAPVNEIINLNDVLRSCIISADPDGQRTTLETMSDPLGVQISHAALCRVIDNLLGNAFRYGNTARVFSEQRGKFACFTMKDDGPGIAPKDIKLVFEPFYRAEPSRNRAHGGTGLGLSIVKQILDAHGGAIELENRHDGNGLAVTVCIPLAK